MKDCGRTDAAVEAMGQAAGVLNALAVEASVTEGLRATIGKMLWQLGNAWLQLDRLDDAEQAHQRALKTFQMLSAEVPANPYYRQEQAYSHRHLFNLAQRAGRTADAERHLGEASNIYRELVAEVPGQPFYRQEATFTAQALADLYAQSGQWEKAAGELTVAARTASPAGQPEISAFLALLHAARQDESAYRRTCATLVEGSPNDSSGGSGSSQIALACILLPDAGVDADQVVRIAERAVAADAKHPDHLLALGAALHRAGRFGDAVKTLSDAEAAHRREQAAPTPGTRVITPAACGQLFLAMAHHRLGQGDQAAAWMKQAAEAMDRPPAAGAPSVAPAWSTGLTLQVLRKEAEAQIASAPQ
jgi:tetratricopeptide (TPR) repeat protein